jgi:hypothetical protein
VIDDLGVLLEFFDAGETTEEELDAAYEKAVEFVDDVEFRSTLNEPEDELSCIWKSMQVLVEQKVVTGPICSFVCISCGEKKTVTKSLNSIGSTVMWPA